MRLQDLKHLEAAMEAFTTCVDGDMLLATLLTYTQRLFHTQFAGIWLAAEGDRLHLHLADGASAAVTSGLQRVKMSAHGERSVARRLHTLGYRAILTAPLRLHARTVGIVATGSQRSRPSHRIAAAMLKVLVRQAVSVLEHLPLPPSLEREEARQRLIAQSERELETERMRLLNLFISGITHDLNNTMTTLRGRVELLMNRLRDQATLQHLEIALHAITEGGQMIRHMRDLMSGHHEGRLVLIDLNQLVTDSLQIARSTWFQAFRQAHTPVDLEAELHPVPAIPGRPADQRIVLLSLLRHAMDATPPPSRLLVRTWSEGEGAGQAVCVSISDDPGRFPTAERQGGIGLLQRGLPTPESQRALAFILAVVGNLDGRITVHQSAGGGSTTVLTFWANRRAAEEP
jgi:signal transduction histidine kinase